MPSGLEDTSYQIKSSESDILIRKFKDDKRRTIQLVLLPSAYYHYENPS